MVYNSFMFSVRDWHNRFLHQASWTAGVRKYLLEKIPLTSDDRVLDVGFGTGAVTDQEFNSLQYHGIDLKWEFLQYSIQERNKNTRLVNGDAYFLPYKNNVFCLVVCHYLLLWIAKPMDVIHEMMRVCKSEGHIIFFAEPDYGGRIDFPQSLEEAEMLQIASLINQGADPYRGRKLLSYAKKTGLINIEVGILGYQSSDNKLDQENWKSEWGMLKEDLNGMCSEDQLERWYEIEKTARQDGTRIQFIPTFYLWAESP